MIKSNLKAPVIFETKYDIKNAKELENKIEEKYSGDKESTKLLTDYPTVYVITSPSSEGKFFSVYVGETNDIQRRTIEHLGEDPKNRKDFADFESSDDVIMYVIGQEHFNKSMTLDIENRLMQYLTSVSAVSKLNNRRFNEQNKYYDSEEFDELFNKIWDQLHQKNEKLFPNSGELKTKAIFKSSPFNKLTDEQLKVKTEVINKIDQALQATNNSTKAKLILIEGQAGSGKTVLVSNIFYDLIHQNRLSKKTDLKVSLLVNQNEQLKVYEEISSKLFPKDQKIRIMKPATFINKTSTKSKDDIVFIDEAHLLLTQNSQSYYGHGKKMIDDIIRRARVVLAVFDPNQILSIDSIIDNGYLEKLVSETEGDIVELHNQMRIDANEKTINWIHNLVDNGQILPIPEDEKYEIKIFDDPGQMQKEITDKNQNQFNGISRMVATFDWEYSGGKKKLPPNQKYWEVSDGSWKMPWNYEIKRRDQYEKKNHIKSVKYSDLPWAEKDYTIKEIGSLYTVQGFDLNYVGVVLGKSVKYRNRKIIHEFRESQNKKATNQLHSEKSYANKLLKNEFNVLMTRGVHGLYIYAVDPSLRHALKKAQNRINVNYKC